MEKDVLVILMVAFGIFAIVMFILFFIYLRKYYNNKHIEDDYKKQIDADIIDDIEEIKNEEPPTGIVPPITPIDDDIIEPHIEEIPKVEDIENDMEFIPIKKK